MSMSLTVIKTVVFKKYIYFYSGDVDVSANGVCSPSSPDEKFAIIVHGWIESCQTEWIRELIPSNLFRICLIKKNSIDLNFKD